MRYGGVKMQRNKAFKRGRLLPLLAAGAVGYVVGGWHATAMRGIDDLTASGAVALRFPQEWEDASTPSNTASALLSPDSLKASAATATLAANNAQAALLIPVPMMRQTPAQPAAQQQTAAAADQQATLQTASAEDVVVLPAPSDRSQSPQARAPRAAAPPVRDTKPSLAAARRPLVNRPGYMLDDAQIASIKERLNLTPDQQQMWPVVEAALRNMAYTHSQEARARNAAANAAQTAAVDPDAVQGLKSAATPLIMSFNDEQKEEVRNLVHVMGLDQLASQF